MKLCDMAYSVCKYRRGTFYLMGTPGKNCTANSKGVPVTPFFKLTVMYLLYVY